MNGLEVALFNNHSGKFKRLHYSILKFFLVGVFERARLALHILFHNTAPIRHFLNSRSSFLLLKFLF